MVVNTTAVAVLLITFFALILLRVNIAFAVGAASTLCLMYLGMPLSNVCQQMVKGLNSFSLMAVPMPDGDGRDIRKADCLGQFTGWMDARGNGHG